MNQQPILQPGKNCWRIEPADRVRFLVDGAAYFHAFRETAKLAEHSLLIIGWDVDSRFELLRDGPGDGLPSRLGDFLERLVEQRPQLQIHVLDWDFAMIYAPDREWLPLYKLDWTTHRRLHFRLDNTHPPGASHHQKVVVVDDCVAFVGGLDFALGRWDTPAHRADDARRREPDQTTTQPYHDLQMMVGGPVARALGDLARARWHTATGQQLRAPEVGPRHDPWPPSVTVDLEDAPVAIARTYPQYRQQPEVREIEQLLVDAVRAARHSIYIENQYFTAHKIGAALAERLAEAEGPEVVVVLPEHSEGWLSQNTMDVLRERLLRRLLDADRHHRLGFYSPQAPGLEGQCINVHAKLLLVDQRLLRIGSANFNNRSMGLDSECDLAIEAAGDGRVAAAIGALRDRLLAEHLGVEPAAVARAQRRSGTLLGAIETLRGGPRTLQPFRLRVSREVDAVVPDARIADPERAIDGEYLARQLVSDEERRPTRHNLAILAGFLLAALALAAIWRWTPLGSWFDVGTLVQGMSELRGSWLAPLIVAGVYLLGGLLVVPVTMLIVATGVVFGAGYGFVYALAGAELSALTTYAIGQGLGHETIQRLSQRWVARASRRLARQGLLAVITLRVVPVAPFTVINLAAGASHIRLRDFALGTLLGMAPGTLALTVFSDQVVAAIAAPDPLRTAVLAGLALLIGGGAWWLGRWLTARQRRRAADTDAA
jgi:phosphatidylserine/phosphatidylglycerophosphate/cardiolipin synthase-like enzyme/uncharacterized membrane protein YdjX (TVP38/TMEM64 family)